VFVSDTEKDSKLLAVNSNSAKPPLTTPKKSLGLKQVDHTEVARVLSRAISKSVLLGEGHVFIPMPPKGTRPGVAAEVGRLMDLVRAMGFDVTRFEDGAVQYDSPPFERNALQAAGIRLASYDWRQADLCVLRLLSPNTRPRPVAVRSCGRWTEELLCGTRLRLRRKGVGMFADPTLVSLVAGDVLPSVSRRHPLRRSVDVWTTGNHVFSCAGTAALRTIIRSLARGQDPALRVACALGRGLSNHEKHLIGVAAEQQLSTFPSAFGLVIGSRFVIL
jgi:hypothetical protein